MSVVYRKLVCDRIPEIIQSEVRRPVTRVLGDRSYWLALLAKLVPRWAAHDRRDELSTAASLVAAAQQLVPAH